MAERLPRAQPDSVANNVKARQSLIERAVTWLATESGWARGKRSAICGGKLCEGFTIFEQCCPCARRVGVGFSAGTGTPHRQLSCWATFILFPDAASQRYCAARERRLSPSLHRQPAAWIVTLVFLWLLLLLFYYILFYLFLVFFRFWY